RRGQDDPPQAHSRAPRARRVRLRDRHGVPVRVIVRPAHRTDARRIAVLSGQLGYPATSGEIESRLDCLIADGRNGVFVAVGDGVVGVWIAARLVRTLEGGS